MRRIFLAILATLTFMSITGGASVYALAESGPYVPGDALFPVQVAAERARLSLIADPTARAWQQLDLADRRVRNLRAVSGTEAELLAMAYLDQALDEAAVGLGRAPHASQTAMRARLGLVADNALTALDTLTQVTRTSPEVVALERAKVGTFRLAAANPDVTSAGIGQLAELDAGLPEPQEVAAATVTDVSIEARAVPFPAGDAVGHDFFPIDGGHTGVACSTCHASGEYRGTSADCASCHTDLHAGANGQNCDQCHSVDAGSFSVLASATAGTTSSVAGAGSQPPGHPFDGNCIGCHAPPEAGHGGGQQCSACHLDTDAGFGVLALAATGATGVSGGDFDGAAAAGSQPPGHPFDGNCMGCHAPPEAGHGGGQQCSVCHSATGVGFAFGSGSATTADSAIAIAANVPASSSGGPPPGHPFDGNCAGCHGGGSGEATSMAGGGAGGSGGGPPPGHPFDGNCAGCHGSSSASATASAGGTTTAAGAASSSGGPPPGHPFDGNCAGCHGSSSASATASAGGTTTATGTASGSGGAPPGHPFDGNCAGCHGNNIPTTTAGGGASASVHPFDGNCAGCHTAPSQDHGGGQQCSVCHSAAASSFDDDGDDHGDDDRGDDGGGDDSGDDHGGDDGGDDRGDDGGDDDGGDDHGGDDGGDDDDEDDGGDEDDKDEDDKDEDDEDDDDD